MPHGEIARRTRQLWTIATKTAVTVEIQHVIELIGNIFRVEALCVQIVVLKLVSVIGMGNLSSRTYSCWDEIFYHMVFY